MKSELYLAYAGFFVKGKKNIHWGTDTEVRFFVKVCSRPSSTEEQHSVRSRISWIDSDHDNREELEKRTMHHQRFSNYEAYRPSCIPAISLAAANRIIAQEKDFSSVRRLAFDTAE
jgi:mannitol/fructose-specific phosphotransferase system IIA component (Ntr-type)